MGGGGERGDLKNKHARLFAARWKGWVKNAYIKMAKISHLIFGECTEIFTPI